MTVLGFATEEEAVKRANDTRYGLGAGVLTRDIMRAHRLADRLEAGNVWVNNWNVTPVEVRETRSGSSGVVDLIRIN